MFFNDMYDFLPIARSHVARINRRVERLRVNAVAEAFQFRHIVAQLFPVEVFEGAGLWIFHHSDGAACIYNEYGRNEGRCVHADKDSERCAPKQEKARFLLEQVEPHSVFRAVETAKSERGVGRAFVFFALGWDSLCVSDVRKAKRPVDICFRRPGFATPCWMIWEQ